MFVEKLARSSNGAAINYKLVDLEKFVDSFKDVAALVYVKSALRFCITFSSLPWALINTHPTIHWPCFSISLTYFSFNNKEGTYSPKGKEWIKKGLEKHILKQAAAASNKK